MPVFSLDDELVFPHPTLRDPDGLLAVGGSLSPERILLAYRWGIFPWFHSDQPILWWWLTPRLMVRPSEIHISHSVRNAINQKKFRVTIDKDFENVIHRCSAVPRPGQSGGTWILPEMIEAYTGLFRTGYAHSVEVMSDGKLVGGLYGIALGKIFFGESMFSEKPNASKTGFIFLAKHLESLGFEWIDCQQDTPHMRTLGGQLIAEDDFLNLLRENQRYLLNAKENGIKFI
ncbi:MAG TPA: leucyl/phenylalanyl-tRNA--protein transferase [Saprospiraceae bacterium]|nr:leucyl/phenylalanyl-tRNA--protein transferase [Saprospiraceae bacterium]